MTTRNILHAKPWGRQTTKSRTVAILLPAILISAVTVTSTLRPTPAQAADSETVEETYDNGQIKIKYEVVNGKKQGDYFEYYDDGTTKIEGRYKNDLFEGRHITFHPNGNQKIIASYKKGKLQGKYIEKDDVGEEVLTASYSGGKLHGTRTLFKEGKAVSKQEWVNDVLAGLNGFRAHTRSKPQVERALKKIHKTRVRLKGVKEEHVLALRHLNAFRFLSGVPADVRLDPKRTKYAQAGARLIALRGGVGGEITENPGMPEKEFDFATTGAARSNLVGQAASHSMAIDVSVASYNRDNPSDIESRMRCLSLTMGLTGFGDDDTQFAMFADDASRRPNKKWQMVCFPPAGYSPVDYVKMRSVRSRTPLVWSVALNPKLYTVSKTVSVQVFPLDDELIREEPLEIALTHFKDKVGVDGPSSGGGNTASTGKKGSASAGSKGSGESGFSKKKNGIGGYQNWLVFQPEEVNYEPGQRYWVRIRGVTTAQGRPTLVQYMVEFIEPVDTSSKKSDDDDDDSKKKSKKRKKKKKSRSSDE